MTSELNPVSDAACYHGQRLRFNVGFCCLPEYYVYGYKELWNEVRVKILWEKYSNELNNWMKLQSYHSYPTKAWCTQMLEPASLGLNSLSFISCVMRDNFLFFQRHVFFNCKMVMMVHVTKRCCKDCIISVHVIFLGHTNWSWRW